MTALRSIAVKPDNTRLYIADYYKGVLVVDPVQQVSAILGGPENTNFGGIVSLIHEQENLIIVQSDYQPQRVVQFGLDASGGNVLSRLPVASGMTEFDHPGLALVKDNSVYYFANLGNGDDTSTTKPALLMRSPMAVETEIPVLNSAAGNEPQG
jgi:DNA-binding beta-propeller fold protein YncE